MSDCDEMGHDYEEVIAVLFVYANGMVQEKVRAYHCNDCGAYYISEGDYLRIKRTGTIMCQVFSKESFEDYKNRNEFAEGLNEESVLHRIGYNVSQSENLSPEARMVILMYAIESGLMERRDIINHLSWLLEINDGKRGFENANSKWSEDRDWIIGCDLFYT